MQGRKQIKDNTIQGEYFKLAGVDSVLRIIRRGCEAMDGYDLVI